MFSNAIEVLDCFWNRPKPVDTYTHLRLYKDGVKSHQYKVTFGRRSKGGSTGWKFRLDQLTTWSIEVYSSAHHAPLTRRISMNEEHETRILKNEDFDKFRYVEADNLSSSKEPILACDIKMAFGTITLHIVHSTQSSLSNRLHNFNEFIANASSNSLLQCVERLEPTLDKISRVGDVIGTIHPVVKGIVVSLQGIYQELKGMTRMHREIFALVDDMCHMLDHLEKIKPCMDQQLPGSDESLKRVLPKMEAVMKETCELFGRISEDSKRKRAAVLGILSGEQAQNMKRLQTRYSSLKAELDLVLAVDVFVKVREVVQNLDALPKSKSFNNLHREFSDPWGAKSKAEMIHIESIYAY